MKDSLECPNREADFHAKVGASKQSAMHLASKVAGALTTYSVHLQCMQYHCTAVLVRQSAKVGPNPKPYKPTATGGWPIGPRA